MILVDTSVWVDHLRRTDARLQGLLVDGAVSHHPWVAGELALGGLTASSEVMSLLRRLPTTQVATDAELVRFIDTESLGGAGIGFVEAGLLAACRLTPATVLWTRDRRLHSMAVRLGVNGPTG